ncbi:hypothetical protein CR513_35406, partial [Mucuna pruriens]
MTHGGPEKGIREGGRTLTIVGGGQDSSQEIDETQVPLNFREVVVEPFGGTQDPHAHLQAFQTQMYISGGIDKLSCKLFPGTLRGVAVQWMATLPARTI